jgi:uncharacterized protein YyaL (SSP411 family)
MTDQHSNRLIHETSPYLLQHAHNPVDWHPWGQEALDKAKKEDKLLLISIGYSACHWCHVMEHESFEDSLVAEIMNDHFICIKVDREERPDIDQVYMDAVQLLTGRGGWPLNSFALPDGRPVYGGTYFRKSDWKNLLTQLAQLYQNDRKKLYDQADAIQEGMLKQETTQLNSEDSSISKTQVTATINKMGEGFDTELGGFNDAPKFPMPSIWQYLLHYVYMEDHPEIKDQLLLTLNKMAYGGIYDHVGGGFARYSVDVYWHVPHFEKMLYDNSQLVSLYSQAYTLTKNKHYKRVVYETLRFIDRELSTPEGAFYSALDADSEGEEGKFYVWTALELKNTLGKDYPLIAEYYTVTENGNWESGNNVLMSHSSAEQFSLEKNIQLNDFLTLLEITDSKLLNERSKRIRPGLDDKVLTSWNALMLKGLIDAYEAFGNKNFLETALQNARFIQKNMLQNDGRLHRTYKNGKSKINGYLDDYSFTIEAFIALYQSTFDEEWLELAHQLSEYALLHFYDPESGFFFYTSDLDDPLVIRKKEISDNVIPSSNASMAHNMSQLSNYYENINYADISQKMVQTMTFEIQQYGRFYSKWGTTLLSSLYGSKEVVVTGPDAEKYVRELKTYHPANVIYAVAENSSELPLFEGRFVKGKTMIYVCQNRTCKLPVESVEEALKLMNGK